MRITSYLSILVVATIFIGCTAGSNGTSEYNGASENHTSAVNHASNDNQDFSKTIDRAGSNDFEQNLIRIAESQYPSREDVLDAAPSSRHDKITESKHWWYTSFDGVRIPFAITADAVNYYGDFIDSLATNEQNDFYESAALDYVAQVTFHESFEVYEPGSRNPTPDQLLEAFEDVYVVEMELNFTYTCVTHCFLSTAIDRIVVFDKDGNLLGVFHDGPALATVA